MKRYSLTGHEEPNGDFVDAGLAQELLDSLKLALDPISGGASNDVVKQIMATIAKAESKDDKQADFHS